MPSIGFMPEYVNEVEPVALAPLPPPKPVEPGLSAPQKGAKHAVAYTLYRNDWTPIFGLIPLALRSSRSPKHVNPNSAQTQRNQQPTSILIRRVPSSYSDSVLDVT